MPKCVRIRRKHRKVCIGDLNDVIILQCRKIQAPESGVDATEEFNNVDDAFALIETVTGEEVFDDTNTAVDVTHKITISFIEGITPETWIEFNCDRLDILNVENLEERDEWLVLRCTDKGTKNNKANEA